MTGINYIKIIWSELGPGALFDPSTFSSGPLLLLHSTISQSASIQKVQGQHRGPFWFFIFSRQTHE
jgi:hypothetical protein